MFTCQFTDNRGFRAVFCRDGMKDLFENIFPADLMQAVFVKMSKRPAPASTERTAVTARSSRQQEFMHVEISMPTSTGIRRILRDSVVSL